MAKARVITKRRKAVRNIRKITRTMQLIATSKFQRAHARVAASRPYAEKIAELVARLTKAAGGQLAHPLLEQREGKTDLLLVLTSNRGLCGGYNAAVMRAALAHAKAQREAGRQVRLDVVGRKGTIYLKFLGVTIDSSDTDIGEKPTFAKIQKMADRYIALFAHQKAVESVHVAYMRFLSGSVQRPTVVQLLPLGDLSVAGPTAKRQATETGIRYPLEHYDFSPAPEQLLAELLPATVRVRLMQCMFEALVSEQVARMTAMKAATENAEDMISLLTRQYNRARQGQITKEIGEIIGGSEALK